MASDWVARQRQRLEAELAAALPASPAGAPEARLYRAMRYSLLEGGKRLRPLLCLAAAEAASGGAAPEAAWPLATALELLHTYSLIHDDLPALDNDDLRRGRPTCHKQFGEATAILAGDALLTLAFAQFGDRRLAGRGAEYAAVLAAAAAAMVAGQSADLEAEAGSAGAEQVEFIHRQKTAAVIRAALLLGGMAGGAGEVAREALGAAGEELGLAFQIMDDILDVTGSAEELGKSAGKDEAQRKATYPAVFGLELSRAQAEALGGRALERLARFGAAGEPLRALARQMVRRTR